MRQASHSKLISIGLTGIVLLGTLGGVGIATSSPPAPESLTVGATACPASAPVRHLSLVAVPVPVAYNNWGDFDPHAALFVLEADVVALLDQTSASLADAGVPELAEPVGAMASAFAAGEVARALDASIWLSESVEALLSDPTDTQRGRLRPVPLAQPAVLRSHIGDCVALRLTNLLPEAVGLEVLGAVSPPGAVGGAPALVAPGWSHEYRIHVPDAPAMEGAHILRSPADVRDHVRRGLFGALVAQPREAVWLSPSDAATPLTNGASAIIDMPAPASDFREFVVVYHDEAELWNSMTMRALPVIDPYDAYGPGTKAINLRAEPFMDRFGLHDSLEANGTTPTAHDKSLGYSSYAYGDPGVFIPKSYVGEPTKFRIVNVGPGQTHVHHLHGGGIRWRATPLVGDTQFDDGLVKDGSATERPASDRVDVITLGPGESFNAEPEGGAGGVQQTVGDLLYHCHIVEHYLAGMWSIWRIYNTRQDGLAELPDRAGGTPRAVDSTQLLGRSMPDGTTLTHGNVVDWLAQSLPPRGRPGTGDASVWDWSVEHTPDGPLLLGEPETTLEWPNYVSDTPGERPAILFHPENGRPAFPLLRPHLGERPPFGPDHGPAPYLGPDVTPWRPDGLCPGEARSLRYDLVAVSAPVRLNALDVDPGGEVFAPAAAVEGILNGTANPQSLVLRANRGDCVDVTLTNRLQENADEDVARGLVRKVNIHIHLVQFDIQGSDGVIVGFNFEQSVRTLDGASRPDLPAVATVTATAAPPVVSNGRTTVPVLDVGPFLDADGNPKIGSRVGIGLGEPTIEQARLVHVDVANQSIVLDRELENAHPGLARVGYEFVNYRWYADVELGAVYFHDHVDGLKSWMRGLYGSLIVEPYGSRWLDPKRAQSDPSQSADQPTLYVADIVDPAAPDDPTRTFREVVLQVFDRGCVASASQCSAASDFPRPATRTTEPAGFNARSEPLWRRNAQLPLSSEATYGIDDRRTAVDERTLQQGDPATPLLEAYPGDPVVVRLVYTGQTTSAGVGTFGLTGHRFRSEIANPLSRPMDTLSLGISDQHNLRIECGAGGCARQPGDYLYFMTNPSMLDRGAWGLFRIHEPDADTALQLLPVNPAPAVGPPPGQPDRSYRIVAAETDVVSDPLTGESRRMAVFAHADAPRPASPQEARPLVLRSVAGETVEVNLTNELSTPVTFHVSLLSGAPTQLGLPVGRNEDPRVMPGTSRSFRIVSDAEVGVAHVMSLARPARDAADGLYGAWVVEPAGSTFSSPSEPAAVLTMPDGRQVHEQVLLYHDRDPQFQTSTMPYAAKVAQPTLVNLQTAPFVTRAGPPEVGTCDVDENFCGDAHGGIRARARSPLNPFATSTGEPDTPVVTVPEGAAFVLRVLGGAGEQVQTHELRGHAWAADWSIDDCRFDHATCRSNLVSASLVGPRQAVNAWVPEAGPGGAGDYVYGSGRAAFAESGAWGIVRVT